MIKFRTRRPQQRGFALIISLSLMAFLVLLMIGLSTLIQVELSVGSHEKNKVKAQQNALLGMQVALAQLQTYAGPDQRVTARADLQYGSTTANKYWTGVYGSSIEPNYQKDPVTIALEHTDPLMVDEKGSSARLLNWLVSGNEFLSFDPATHISPSGNVIEAVDDTLISYKPDLTIDGLTDNLPASATSLKIGAANHPARVLVGPGSVTETVDYVVAPLVDVGEPDESGGYAWWVGDEGVKASANLPIETEDADKIYAFTSANRAAIELMADGQTDDQNPIFASSKIGEQYDASDTRL